MAYSYFTQGAQGPAVDQIFDLLVQLLPRGAARFYGLDRKAGDVWNYFMGIAETMKAFAFDAIATLKKEINPATAVYLLPEYEQWLGLSQTPIAVTGTNAQRQAQVISKLREQGAATVNNVQGILAPLLGYANASQLAIIEANRSALTTLHTYTNGTGASIGANGSVTQVVYANDDGSASDAGAQLTVTITSTNPEQLSFVLTGPTAVFGGTGTGQASITFPAGSLPAGSVTSVSFQLNDPTISPGKYITGNWTLQINTGAATCTLVSWSLFVEGGGSRDSAGNSGLGEQMHNWIVQFNSGLSGSTPNFPATLAALARIQPADSVVTLVQNVSAKAGASLVGPFLCLNS